MSTVQLSTYDKRGYHPKAGLLKRGGWYLVNALLFNSWLLPVSPPKRWLLRCFGAMVGQGVVIKPRVNVKYPWLLRIGAESWIGEGAWIDNLTWVDIGNDVCISQEAYLLTGNHDYKDPSFGLLLGAIRIEEGAWIGARAVVCPGVTLAAASMVTAGSVIQQNTEACGIYRGNPAQRYRTRVLRPRNG